MLAGELEVNMTGVLGGGGKVNSETDPFSSKLRKVCKRVGASQSDKSGHMRRKVHKRCQRGSQEGCIVSSQDANLLRGFCKPCGPHLLIEHSNFARTFSICSSISGKWSAGPTASHKTWHVSCTLTLLLYCI